MLFGENIKKYRQYLCLSSYNFAIAADISYSYLSNIENGKSIPSTKTAVSMLNVLNIIFDECMNGFSSNLKEIYKDIISNSLDLLSQESLEFILKVAILINYEIEDK